MLFLPHKVVVAAVSVSLLIPSATLAQTNGAPDREKVRMRFGPLWLNPTIALSNVGLDTNVFNEADTEAPKRDFTMTVTPQTDLWLKLGRTWAFGTLKEDLLYYGKYAGERSANTSYRIGWQVPFNRVVLAVTGTYLNARDRPGFEIDARSQRTESSGDASAEIRAFPKTFFKVAGGRQRVNFAKDAGFLDANLHFELNRTSTHGVIAVRHQTTPLTSFALSVTRTQDRFEFSPLRDANSTALAASVTFDPFALIKGTASFGYSDFEPLSPGVPKFKGATAALDLSYVAFSTTRFAIQGTRDVQYSFDINSPYYVQTGAILSLTQHVFGPLDVVGRFGAQRLDYRNRAAAALPAVLISRADYIHTYGGGVGYRLGRDVRIGLNVDRQSRTSAAAGRRYHGLKLGTSVTYGRQ